MRVARQQERPPVGVDVRRPPGRAACGIRDVPKAAFGPRMAGEARQDRYGAAKSRAAAEQVPGARPTARQDPQGSTRESHRQLRSARAMSSSIDGKLYVVLTAENFHPGKGTPTTQIDMRRISDGVKIAAALQDHRAGRARLRRGPRATTSSTRTATATIFMNPENYEQVTVPDDIIGDQAAYLQEGMKVHAVASSRASPSRSSCRSASRSRSSRPSRR